MHPKSDPRTKHFFLSSSRSEGIQVKKNTVEKVVTVSGKKDKQNAAHRETTVERRHRAADCFSDPHPLGLV